MTDAIAVLEKLASQTQDPRARLLLLARIGQLKQQQKQDPVAELRERIASCQACAYRYSCRRPVPWSGDLAGAEVVCVGEAPGATEDALGKPFVGKAGEVLEYLLERLPIPRDRVAITNVVKCRPPRNETPADDKFAACAGYLKEELELTRADVIVALGATAMKFFFPDQRITQNHGLERWWKGKIVFPTFHPAAGLRDPNRMKEIEEDFGYFADWLQDYPQEWWHRDPRPDLSEDHAQWTKLLVRAWRTNHPKYWTWQGLRCAGANLNGKGLLIENTDVGIIAFPVSVNDNANEETSTENIELKYLDISHILAVIEYPLDASLQLPLA